MHGSKTLFPPWSHLISSLNFFNAMYAYLYMVMYVYITSFPFLFSIDMISYAD